MRFRRADLHVILGRPVRVESTCPVTGREIRLDVEPDRVVAVTPDTAVVSADLRGLWA